MEEQAEPIRLPHLTLILPLSTSPNEARQHAEARLVGALASFTIRTIALKDVGEFNTPDGKIYGKKFMAVLEPIPDEDEEDGEVVYVHPDYKNLIRH